MALLERDLALAHLAELFASCRRGRGGVVVVSGAVGVGKTDLMHTFAQQAVSDGAVFLHAEASLAERALPLGVVGQLSRSMGAPAEISARLAQLAEEATGADAPSHQQGGPIGPAAPVLRALSVALHDLAARCPVVIGVDDVHHADPDSLHCLLYLIRRVTSAGILVILNESAHASQAYRVFQADLFGQPHWRRTWLGPLTVTGVAGTLREFLDAEVAYRLAPQFHAISGGNPRLVRALIEDVLAAPATEAAEVVVADAFADAVRSCLYRSEPTMLSAARGLAILGAEPHQIGQPPAQLGNLVGLSAESVAEAIDALCVAGLVDGGQFRHAHARAAVLDGMASGERACMHRRAALLLHDDGAAPAIVARHLIATDCVEGAWVFPILREAAEQALLDGDLDLALRCLGRAARECIDEHQQATVKSLLTRAKWQVNPSTAVDRLPELAAAIRDGHLRGRHAVTPINYMLWHGQVGDAVAALTRLSDSVEAPDAETTVQLGTTRVWLSYAYPELAASMRGDQAEPDQSRAAVMASPPLQTVVAVLTAGATNEGIAVAEQILQRRRLDDAPLAPSTLALTTLIFADRLDTAAFWCEELLNEGATREAPTWHALLMAGRAMIAERRGDLGAAESHARAALTEIAAKSWGVAIGLPLATLLLATTAMGRYDEGAAHLRLPVPAAMCQTPSGLLYLNARGRYHLATGRTYAALADFQACGSLMTKWDLDRPALVGWRTHAAEAYLKLGRIEEAAELVNEQMAQADPGPSRARGALLRILAATVGLAQRPAVLSEAVAMLQQSHDRLELARALADLGDTYHAQGDRTRARIMVRRAHHLAKQCGAGAILDTLPLDVNLDGNEEEPGTGYDVAASELTDAERRVASLAAQGQTNREIAARLYITVSTVEQHLTRVYKKLNVSRRSDLPPGLWLESQEGRWMA